MTTRVAERGTEYVDKETKMVRCRKALVSQTTTIHVVEKPQTALTKVGREKNARVEKAGTEVSEGWRERQSDRVF